jgi:hypothetical protein
VADELGDQQRADALLVGRVVDAEQRQQRFVSF